MCRRNINILSSQSWAQGREVYSVYSLCLYCLIIACRNQNQLDKLYGRIIGDISHIWLFMLISHIFMFLYLIGLILSIYLILCVCLLRFSKITMFKLLFTLLVIKQLLGNLTSNIDIYSAKLSIIRLGKAKWWW